MQRGNDGTRFLRMTNNWKVLIRTFNVILSSSRPLELQDMTRHEIIDGSALATPSNP